MTKQNVSLKGRIGISLIIFGFICTVFGLLVPSFGLSTGITSILVSFFMVGGPGIFMIAVAALAGMEGITLVQNKIKRMTGLPEGRYPAPKSQYYLAVEMMILCLISLIIPYFIPGIEEMLNLETYEWYYFVIGDVVFVMAFLFIGGDQFIAKLGKVFTWEPRELPPKKGKEKK